MNYKDIISKAKDFSESFSSNQLVTMKSVKKLDDNIYLLDYRNDYHIDELLEKGVSSIGGLLAFAADSLTFGLKLCKIGGDEGAGCTTFEAYNPKGEHLLARNFDFKTAPCFVVWTHPEGRYSSISTVDANFMLYGSKPECKKLNSYRVLIAPYCPVDGLNEKGLAIAVLQMRAKPTNQTDPSKRDITTTAMIRGVLDTCADTDEAVEFIKKYNMHDSIGVNYHYQIVDKRGRSVVVEYIDGELHIYDKKVDSCGGSVYEDDGLPLQYVSNFSVTKDTGDYKIEQHGEDRIAAVLKTLRAKDGVLDELEAMDLLSYVKLNYKHDKYPWSVCALWSVVFNTDTGFLKFAANTDYKKIYTFNVSEPCKVHAVESIDKSEYFDTLWSH